MLGDLADDEPRHLSNSPLQGKLTPSSPYLSLQATQTAIPLLPEYHA